MKARVSIIAAFVAALAVVPAVAFGNATHAASNSKTYPDSTGEDAQAPDITSLTISNDDARNIVFKINISNRPTLTADMTILGFVDADANEQTGDTTTLGADYAIELDPGAVALYKWDGSDYTFASEQTSLTFSYDATGAVIRINAADLGDTKSFKFAWIAVSGITTDASGNADFTNAHRDAVPDFGHGFATYDVIAKLQLKATAFSLSPNPAKAGKRFSASLAAQESDTNGPVKAGTVSCAGKIGTKAVPATHSLAAGVATCNWKVPSSAKGKTLRGTVKLVVKGTTLTKSFSVKIR
jgi:hypothetical protein